MCSRSYNNEQSRPDRKFQLLCSDVLDPKAISSDNKKLIVSFTDIFSGFIKSEPIIRRSEIPSIFANYHKWLSNRFPDSPVSDIRTDGALEYTKGIFHDYCKQSGINTDSGCPYEHQLHRIAERKNRHIQESLRALLSQSGIETALWPYALKMVEYLLNRSPTKSNREFVTPFEIVYGKKTEIGEFVSIWMYVDVSYSEGSSKPEKES